MVYWLATEIICTLCLVVLYGFHRLGHTYVGVSILACKGDEMHWYYWYCIGNMQSVLYWCEYIGLQGEMICTGTGTVLVY